MKPAVREALGVVIEDILERTKPSQSLWSTSQIEPSVNLMTWSRAFCLDRAANFALRSFASCSHANATVGEDLGNVDSGSVTRLKASWNEAMSAVTPTPLQLGEAISSVVRMQYPGETSGSSFCLEEACFDSDVSNDFALCFVETSNQTSNYELSLATSTEDATESPVQVSTPAALPLSPISLVNVEPTTSQPTTSLPVTEEPAQVITPAAQPATTVAPVTAKTSPPSYQTDSTTSLPVTEEPAQVITPAAQNPPTVAPVTVTTSPPSDQTQSTTSLPVTADDSENEVSTTGAPPKRTWSEWFFGKSKIMEKCDSAFFWSCYQSR